MFKVTFGRDNPKLMGIFFAILVWLTEGFERGGNRAFLNFLSYTRGSCGEVKSQLARTHDRHHILMKHLTATTAKSIEQEVCCQA